MTDNMNKRTFHAVNTLLLGLMLASGAEATQVQSSLAPSKIGITVNQLLNSTFATNIALPASGSKPAGMGNVVAGVHLGTNTDIFAVGTTSGFNVNATEFWVRYTLDSTSYEYSKRPDWENGGNDTTQTTLPVSGALWLSYNSTTGLLKGYEDKLTAGSVFGYAYQPEFAPYGNQGRLQTLSSRYSGDPDYTVLPGTNSAPAWGMACVECGFQWTLNLAFLALDWNGSRYDLRTSAQGFDQVFAFSSEWPSQRLADRSAANIAPVPVPGALWLFGSSLAGLVAIRRRRIA